MKGANKMKLLFLNKEEKKALIKLLVPLMTTTNTPYELTTILEKLDWRAYEYAFNDPKEDKHLTFS